MNMDRNGEISHSAGSAAVTEKTYLKNNNLCDEVDDPVKYRNPIVRAAQTYDIAILNLFYMFGLAVITSADQDLLLAKVCQQTVGLSEEQCTNRTTNDSSEHDKVYQESNTYLMYKNLISTGPAVVMMLLLGPWSDKYGYKFPIIWTVAGVFMNSFCLMMNSIFFQLPPIYVVLSSLPAGLTGGDIAMSSLTTAYVGSKTPEKNRVFTLLFIELCSSVSELSGTFATGYIFRNHGYTVLFLTSTCFFGAAVLWLVVVVNEKPSLEASLCTKTKDFFSLHEVTEMCRTCVKKREGWLRVEIWALLLANVVHNMAALGTGQVVYYFTQKMYGWDLPKYTQVKSLSTGANAVILPCFMAVVKRWKIADAHLGIFVATCLGIRYVILMFAYTEWLFYLCCALAAFNNSMNVVLNSLLMSCLDENEYGKLFAMKAGLLSAVPLVASPVATGIFNDTISYFIGAVFLYGAGCETVPLAIFILMLRKRNKHKYNS